MIRKTELRMSFGSRQYCRHHHEVLSAQRGHVLLLSWRSSGSGFRVFGLRVGVGIQSFLHRHQVPYEDL